MQQPVFEVNGSFSLPALIKSLEHCPCGREHTAQLKSVCIGEGLTAQTGDILARNNFPKKILAVADKNTLAAADGVLQSLEDAGFDYTLKLYDDLRTAEMEQVNVIEELLTACDGCVSIGTGSLNDICRLACFRRDKAFAIFATAPSMDGFASDSAPITDHGFKVSYPARQPSVIIADTLVLAAAPAVLKSAGFGDMIGKLVALADWRISALITGEHYCPAVAAVTREALTRIISLAPLVTQNNPHAAGEIMKALVLTGTAMQLEGSVRPASGTEHIISHFWEIKKLEQGLLSDFHGRKVGVATLIVNRIYKEIVAQAQLGVHTERVDWDEVYAAYGKNFCDDVKRLNTPPVTDLTTPDIIRDNWEQIRRIVNEELPSQSELISIMQSAGAALTVEDIAVSRELGDAGVKYHPFMRYRMTLMRLLPMLDVNISLTCDTGA